MKPSLILLLAAVLATMALPRNLAAAETHQGQVTSAGSGRIAILDQNGDPEQFDVADDAQITLNGKQADLDDLKSGDVVKLTVKERKGKRIAVIVEGKSKE